MLKKIQLILISLVLIFSFVACGKKDVPTDKAQNNGDKIDVVVSFNTMAEFAKAVGGDKVNVVSMIPKGVEAHDFEPKPKEMAVLSKAKVFIYNGLGMEPWVESALKSIENKNLEVVEASKGANLIANKEEKEIKEHGKYDPHVWLSLREAKQEANNIKEALIKVDGTNKEFYEKNFNEFSSKLDNMQKEYSDKFSQIKNKSFVTGHAAFGYLCRDFNLEQNSVEDVFAEGEATSQKLKDLVDYCKKNNISTVFVEENASPKVSETLAKEVGAKVEAISTLESEGNYIDTMKNNLEKIYSSLK